MILQYKSYWHKMNIMIISYFAMAFVIMFIIFYNITTVTLVIILSATNDATIPSVRAVNCTATETKSPERVVEV